MGWRKHLNNPNKKIKISKNRSQTTEYEHRVTIEEGIVNSNSAFSLYFEIGEKQFTPPNQLLFRINFSFVTKTTFPIYFKNHENA